MTDHDPPSLSTVSRLFVDDWLDALRGYCSARQMDSFLRRADLQAGSAHANGRVTLDQIVYLYQVAAIEGEDEMMGLWSRPIRPRALQHLLTTVQAAETLPSALFRFSTFWNLLLDDFQFEVETTKEHLILSLRPRGVPEIQRFGHMLILKLAHGLLSWLAGYEIPVAKVHLAFAPPEFASDYSVIFPARVVFGAPCSAIAFDHQSIGLPISRNRMELSAFLKRAPRDWIFTSYREHTWSLRVREFLYRSEWQNCHLTDAAHTFSVTARTLIRRLESEGTSFQAIKDGLRRDIAIRDMRNTQMSIETISQELGFSSASNFHRAFRRWTGVTPGHYRRNEE